MLFTKLPDLLVGWPSLRRLIPSTSWRANRPTARRRVAPPPRPRFRWAARLGGPAPRMGSRTTEARRVVALALIVPFVFASCAEPPSTTTAPTVEYSPTPTVPPKAPSGGEITEDEAMAIGYSELARHLKSELGPDWISRLQSAMDGRLVAAGVPADAVEALHDLMRGAIATEPAAEAVQESQIQSDFRRQVRDSLNSHQEREIAMDSVSPPNGNPWSVDPTSSIPPSDNTCDIYNLCRGRNYSHCYRYANLEVKAHEAMLRAGCLFLAAVGSVVTLSGAVVLTGICVLAPSWWSAKVHSDAMDECFTLHCGSGPSSCI